MDYFRIKEVAKSKGHTMADIANSLNISYVALNRRLQTGKFDTIVQIAKFLNCEPAELISVGNNFYHLDIDGEWLGIRKK